MTAAQQLVLVGGGHSHALLLQQLARHPLPGVQTTLVAPSARSAYSGMVPGWLAGAYPHSALQVDLAALCRAAGATLCEDMVMALDPAAQRLLLVSGQVLAYDQLALNIGGTLRPPALPGALQGAGVRLLSLRPMAALGEAWPALLTGAAAQRWPPRITAVGGGAAGVECLLAALQRLRTLAPGQPVQGRLISRSRRLLPGLAAGAARAAEALLRRQGVELLLGEDLAWGQAWLDSGQGAAPVGPGSGAWPVQPGELLLWATSTQAHRWPAQAGLACDAAGFVQVDAMLRSTSHPQVWATGDCAAWAERPLQPLPKSGVLAVRMAPVLAHNLRAALTGTALHRFQPPARSLALLATGDGQAIAAWGPLWARGRWVWRWKDHIDRRFVRTLNPPAR